MVASRSKPVQALLEQAATQVDWLRELSDDEFATPSVLPGWDVRRLTGHLVLVHAGLLSVLDRPTGAAAVPMAIWVRRYRRDVDQIEARTSEVTGTSSGLELVDRLAEALAALQIRLSGESQLPAVVDAARGPSTVADFLATRVVEAVVHADDLSRSLPDREPVPLVRKALSVCSRTLTAILAGQHPGRSIEVRIPPYAAVQCGLGDPGPTHTRGTPPNVVETDALTFLRLATGRTSWADAAYSGRVAASGLRADLSAALPLLS